MTKPIFRLFRLGLDTAYADEYMAVGRTNLETSIRQEDGTLAMFANHLEHDFSQQVVVEVYASDEAYQTHVDSAHFQAFATLAKQALTSRQVITLEAHALLQKPEPLRVFETNQLTVRLAHVKVTDNQAFAAIVLPEMTKSMEQEAGVLVMYAGTVVDSPNDWYFYEIYDSKEAYENHRKTKHFKDYIAKSSSLVKTKNVEALTGDSLVTKEGIH